MKNLTLYSLLALLLGSSLTAPAQTNSAQTGNVIHSPFTSAMGEVDPALVAVAQHSEDIAAQGDEYLKQGSYRAAEAAFQASLEVAKSSATGINPRATRGLAEALIGEGRLAEADQTYRTLIYQEPLKWSSVAEESRTLMKFAALLSQTGHWVEATGVYKQALSKAVYGDAPKLDVDFDPQTPMPLLLQALAHIAIGLEYSAHADSTAAFAEYRKGNQLQPDNALTNYYYGTGWQRLGPTDRLKFGTAQQARAALQKAVKIGNANVKAAALRALKSAG